MSRSPQRGFTIIAALGVILMLGIILLLMAAGSGVMMHDLHRMRFETNRRNLEASAIAWAKHQASNSNAGGDHELDTRQFDLPDSSLKVSIAPAEGGKQRVEVEAVCRFGRRTGWRTSNHVISTVAEGR